MSFKRGLLGIGLGAACALLVACGGDATPGSGESAGAAGSGDAGAGNAGVAGSSGNSSGGSSGAGSANGGSSNTAGASDNAGEGGATDGASGGSAGSSSGSSGSSGAAGQGGGSGNGGSGGSAGTGNIGPQATSSKLDVLFVIDNSVSMADKQDVLENTLPAFVSRITNPLCVDDNHRPIATQPASSAEPCASGKREFTANDVHIGVISTSLGAHGGTVCASTSSSDTLDDKGELLGKLRPGLTTWQDSGFLSWDPAGVIGSANPSDITANLKATIVAAGDHGCGYEAPLEAMYRFLIDPEPPATVAKVNNVTVRQGTDAALLSERAAFLRPDSAVAVLLLSDENDCSIRDDGVGWFVGSTNPMPKSTAACATDPNSACCRSCAQNETNPPSGCLALSADPVCMGAPAGSYNKWDTAHDLLNLRCFDQKQRFGFDLLYPTSRYVSGLSDLMIANNEGALVKNPLFFDSTGAQTRSPTLVTAAVMVGVPWQDLATSASLNGGKLEYLDAAELTSQGRWPILLGDPNHFVPPTDPFMVESIAPRSGTNPVTGDAIAPATSQNPAQNPINGHEQNIASNDDLQYACTFKLTTPRVCTAGDAACDCAATTAGDASAVTTANSPVCQPPTGGPAGTTQYYAKAYPGLRELSVAHALGDRGVATSICPKTLDATDPQFGYAPAFDALLRRVSAALK